jgi:protein-L-isoaspartate(D-aspartate) O-methyltransferase
MVSVNSENFTSQRRRLVSLLSKQKLIHSESVSNAFLTVPREEFVWPNNRKSAYSDTPLNLGNTKQTISAPHMIAIMLEELKLCPGMSVLEIGTGSGYNAALMSEILKAGSSGSDSGVVVTIERVVELRKFAFDNLKRTNYSDFVEIVIGDGTLGYPERCEEKIYDRIIVTAASPNIPRFLLSQLRTGGILLVPVGGPRSQDLEKIEKHSNGQISRKTICGCMFVPLIGDEN